MIRRIQVLNYRCLRYADIELDGFQLLVGPNASGKSTLFDIISFLSDLVADGLETAIEKRTRNFQDLVWGRPKKNLKFELAVEFDLPAEILEKLPQNKNYRVFRYEIAIRENDDQGVIIEEERGILMPTQNRTAQQKFQFPDPPPAPATILHGGRQTGSRTILSKSEGKSDSFRSEVTEKPNQGWSTNISFGPHRSTLRNLPESPEKFPAATHVKRILETKVNPLFLNSMQLRQPSSPKLRANGFAHDGSSLPWAVQRLQKNHPENYREWLEHVKTTLTDLTDVHVVEREDIRYAHLMLEYGTGVKIPSWTASDGTLRLLALTLLAYLPGQGEVYLMEEPENGIHSMAVDCVYQSLTSIYDSQVLFATHSPVVLKMARPEEVLCFAKNAEGATDIVRGNEHPLLQDWQESFDMELLFATGIFG